MHAIASRRAPPVVAHASPSRATADDQAPALRSALVLGCIAAVALAAWAGTPQPSLQADVELAHLLRGMAVIKAAIVLAGIGALFWRFGLPVTPRFAAAYLGGAWAAAGASMLIWQLTSIPLAAALFHAGALALLVAAWRDGLGSNARRPAASRLSRIRLGS